MEDLIQQFAYSYPTAVVILTGLGLVVPLASFIANLTPTKSDDQVVAMFAKVVDFLALNFKAKK